MSIICFTSCVWKLLLTNTNSDCVPGQMRNQLRMKDRLSEWTVDCRTARRRGLAIGYERSMQQSTALSADSVIHFCFHIYAEHFVNEVN